VFENIVGSFVLALGSEKETLRICVPVGNFDLEKLGLSLSDYTKLVHC
jgi:hypothetical protein